MSEAIQIDEDRIKLMLDAVYEADKIARVLPGLVPLDEESSYYAVRAMAGRLLRLTSVLMSGLSDDAVPNEDMKSILSFEISQG